MSWLLEVVRPKPVKADKVAMLRAALGIAGPLALGLALGQPVAGMFAATGGLAAIAADRGGPYRLRVIRGFWAGLAGLIGFCVGLLVRGHGWASLAVVVLASIVAALLGGVGGIGSIAGLQLIIYLVLGTGLPLAGPAWIPPAMYAVGFTWAVLLTLAAWPFHPRAPEKRDVAQVYRTLASLARAGHDGREHALQSYREAQNSAYGTVLAARSAAAGPDRHRSREVMLLNHATSLKDAILSRRHENRDPIPRLGHVLDQMAAAIEGRGEVPGPPGLGPSTPATRALGKELESALGVLRGEGRPGGDDAWRQARPTLRDRFHEVWNEWRYGRFTRMYALRLTLCMAVAAVCTELLPLDRSYWVMLTVGIVLKPDFGSVLARALQRGLGTILGVVLAAVMVVFVAPGPWILLPVAVLAALLPYGQQRNWGLFSTFQAPLVILLVDLLTHGGWSLVEARLLDTLLGCAIVLCVGYLPWPTAWVAPVAPRFADAVDATAEYLRQALSTRRWRREDRERVYTALSDLRASFQRALSEPRRVSGRVTVWWPAIVSLQQVADEIAPTAARMRHGAGEVSRDDVDRLAALLEDVAGAVRDERRLRDLDLPGDDRLAPLASAVRGLRSAVSG
ncbi:FUSC family protein [Bailinhaonella thermotolerans]|uniref:FUSC family protein n=1 Tax=Bailinhaonella thermotolerans TaxID=1070861 RepID=A0A3A4AZI1_9ACTN|nr:FUSC family protein [Bailinhaonella thermotolerans]RJL24782.1 FUSC family protein [Bailinhaonella thermotolerans]